MFIAIRDRQMEACKRRILVSQIAQIFIGNVKGSVQRVSFLCNLEHWLQLTWT